MASEDKYTREVRKEQVEIDKDNLDLETTASICTMLSETLYKEAEKFTEVVEKLTKTYKNEFIIGEFSACIAVSSGVHDEPFVLLVTGSIPGTLKNLKFITKNLKEMMHDEDTN